MTEKAEWKRVPNSLAFVRPEHRGHMAYLHMRYSRGVVDEKGRVGIEEEWGRPVYIDEISPNDTTYKAIVQAARILEVILPTLEIAEDRFGGPPSD